MDEAQSKESFSHAEETWMSSTPPAKETEPDGAARSEYVRGARAMLPILMGVIPMAVVTGIGAVDSGMSKGEAFFSSIAMYAAASQLVAYKMLGNGADALLILAAVFIINLRFTLYSAGISPHLKGMQAPLRIAGAYALSDQAYGITMLYKQSNPKGDAARFFIGAAFTMWVTYQIFALAGIILGTQVPKEFSLDFAVPLTFTAIMIPQITRPELVVAALSSAVLALALGDLPNNAGFFIAAIIGIATGGISKQFFERGN